ncbi:nuclear transport factor 2 family protein [Nocardia sp. NBC_00403]|uniref:nuclear transport factor 2 family protein n=1 Tax=Nocardia sp. NBC_00403 TaxID=2975990 RepID=UPI002E1A5126
MASTSTRPIALTALPAVINRYLSAHRAHDAATAITTFADSATVLDDGHRHDGRIAIQRWLDHSATEYTYTIEPIDTEIADPKHYVVTQHLEGDFPGGTVNLRYQFTLDADLIQALTIEP